MKILLSTIIFALLGFFMGVAGITTHDWQFWAILVCAASLKIVEAIPGKEGRT